MADRTFRLSALLWAFAFSRSVLATEYFLYDGKLGTLPGAQGLYYLSSPIQQPTSSQTLTPQGTRLDTSAVPKELAGYFPKAPGHRLDRQKGYLLEVDLVLEQEKHGTKDRAGFSMILISDDLRGIELGLWQGELWAQGDLPLFHHEEGASLAIAPQSPIRLEVRVLGDGYEAWLDGARVLSGPLRDYSAFGNPYDLPNFYFLGDDTSSAAARVELRRVYLRD